MQKPELSIVIPALNEAKNLEKLLRSIKLQNFPCEVIVADAGSKDDTASIAKRYGSTVIRGGRVAFGRNAGAKAASAERLLFLDADTQLPAGFLDYALKDIRNRKIEVAGVYVVPKNGQIVDHLAYWIGNAWMSMLENLKPCAQGIAIFSSKKVQKTIGGFDESITFGEDSDYVRRASKIAKFGMIRKPVYTSVRRFEKEGRLNCLLKYAYLNIYRSLKGEIRKDVNYKFDHY